MSVTLLESAHGALDRQVKSSIIRILKITPQGSENSLSSTQSKVATTASFGPFSSKAPRADSQIPTSSTTSACHKSYAIVSDALHKLSTASVVPAGVLAQIADQHDSIVSEQAQRIETLLGAIEDLKREKHHTTANELTIDPFNNTLDQVSEGQIRAAVDGLNSSIDEFVMNLVDSASSKPVHLARQKIINSSDLALYEACSRLAPEDDNRGLFMEGLLHDRITQKLATRFFMGNFGVSLTTPFDTTSLDKFYNSAVAKKSKTLSSYIHPFTR
jgi:hypothetical protein